MIAPGADSFAELADALPDVVWTAQPDGARDFCNQAWEDLTGLPRTEFANRWAQAIHPAERDGVFARWSSAVAAGVSYEDQYRLRRADGADRWMLCRARPLRDTAGTILSWLGTAVDIDALKRAEALRTRTERSLTFLAETGTLLAGLRDLDVALQRLADTSVRLFCDVCAMYLIDGGRVRRVACAFAGGDVALTARLMNAPTPTQAGSPTARALSGESVLIPRLDYALTRAATDDRDYAGMIEEIGVVSVISVPIGLDGRRRGALTFFTVADSGTIFGPAELALAEDVGRRMGVTLAVAASLERERRIAVTLQSALLTQSLPARADVAFDATYVPGSREAEVGGDWYDAFELRDGRIGISIGDVSGHGLTAAVAMGKLRQAMQSAAFIRADPNAMLDAADLTLALIEPKCFASAFAAIFDPSSGALAYASAGHPPQLLRRPDGTIEELGATAPLLGIADRGASTSPSTIVASGSLLVLYTDGLTEATRDLIAGEARLHAVVADPVVAAAAHPAQRIHDRVLARPSHDDVAILTLRFGSMPKAAESGPGYIPSNVVTTPA